MYEGATDAAWDHTSHLLWMIATVNQGKRGRKLEPRDFHPKSHRESRVVIDRNNFSLLKTMFRAKNPTQRSSVPNQRRQGNGSSDDNR